MFSTPASREAPSTSRGRRMAPEQSASREYIARVQKKHVDAPVPHDAVSRRRSTSAPLTHGAVSHQSCRRHATTITAETSARVFPTATSTQVSTPRGANAAQSESLLTWGAPDRSTPPRRALRSPSSPLSSANCSQEISLKSLTGERRHVGAPGQVMGGLFSSAFHCGAPANVERARPILRQRDNCVSRGEGPKPKPCRLMRKCSSQSHERGFMFIDSAVVPIPRPHP